MTENRSKRRNILTERKIINSYLLAMNMQKILSIGLDRQTKNMS